MIYHYQVVYDIRLHSIVWYYNMLCCIIYYTLYRYFTMEVWTSFLLSSIHREVTFQPQVLMPSGSSRAALIQFACIAVGTVLPHNDAFIAFVFLKSWFSFCYSCYIPRFCLLLDEDASGDAIRLLEVDIELRRRWKRIFEQNRLRCKLWLLGQNGEDPRAKVQGMRRH